MKRKSLLFLLLFALMAPWTAMAQTTVTSFPFNCGFETTEDASYWQYANGTTNEWWIGAAKYKDGAKGLYISNDQGTSYARSSLLMSSYAYVTLALTASTDYELSFNWTANGESSYDYIRVFLAPEDATLTGNRFPDGSTISGYSAISANISVTPEGWLNLSDGKLNLQTTWQTKTKSFSVTASGNYKLVFMWIQDDGNNAPAAIDNVKVIAHNCLKPTNLACTAATGNPATATFNWTNGGTETDWVLEYGTTSDFTGATSINISASDLVNGKYTLTTGLTEEQQYYARLKADCGSGDESSWSNTISFIPSDAIYIGTGSDESYVAPLVTNYKMSYDQMIYTAEQLNFSTPMTINKIGFNSKAANSRQRTITIYMGHTAKSSFSSTTDFVSIDDLTPVYTSHTWDIAAGWNEFELDESFDYDGTSNLVVAMYSTATNYNSTAFNSTTTTNAQVLYARDDNKDPNPNSYEGNWSSYGGNKQTDTKLPNLKMFADPNLTPKPNNLQVSNITSSGATLSWQAPASATPTSYSYRYNNDINWTSWESTSNLSVALNLQSSTHYTFQVKAIYDGVGESNPIETDFTTLDDCAFPTNLVATTTPGQGTKATLTWVKGYDEEAWVLEYATNADFTEGLVEVTEGFTVEGNNVTANLTGLTAETHYYARVKANCDGPTSAWSDVVDFTPTNYVDYTYNQDATSSTAYGYVPFYGSYVAYATHSRFIIPSTSLADIAGGTVKKLTFYSSTTTANWGDATFKVYVAEVDNATFSASPSTSTPFDWSEMTQVYSGSLSLANGMMEIVLDDSFVYSGTKNLMIGFEETNTGTNATASWYYKTVSNSCAYAYKSSGSATSFSTGRNGYSPKLTFNYLPTPYQKVAAINEGTIAATSAELTWTAPETTATITGYAYQYKLSSAAEWPTAWSNLAASATSVTLQPLTPGTSYDFQIKVLYGEHESAVNSTSFFTECAIVTAFPWKEDFEAYSSGDFIHPCWVNQHISGDGDKIFKVYISANGTNSTHQLQLPDQDEGTLTKLRLPEMNLPGNNYQFVIDVYRSTSTYNDNYPYEGIRVYASTNGEIEGATELAFIPRHYLVSNALIPAESEAGWYTYEIPIGISGTCYIILRGESQYCTSTFMDNLGVEEIPTCARPKDLAYSNVTNHSAKLNWTAGDTEQTLWQIAYSKTSFDPNTANFDVTTVSTVDATANPFVLAGLLDAASTYYVYVRANCGTATEPDYGPWCRKGISFTTLAATPAPSNFVASNPASEKVDMTWNAGGGDFESWELYYVASETAPEAPTATTQASVSDITTLPTTEHPYVLDGLNPVTKYYAWIRAKHVYNNEVTYSDWVALTDNCFETLDACPTPTDLVATNLTSVSADLSWVGSDDVTEGYTVEYGQEGTYSVNETEDFSNQTPVSYSATGGELPEGWYSYNTGTSGYAPRVSNSSNYSYISGLTGNFLLMTTNAYNSTDPSANQYAYAIMPQYSNLGSVSFDYQYESISYGTLTVGYVTNNEGYTTYQVLETPTKASGKQTWSLTATHIATINNANGYVAFRYESGNGTYYSVGIDNVTIKGGTYTPGATQTVQAEGTSLTINDLTPNKTYIAKVKSNCTNGEYCEPVSFTTLADGNKVFTNAANDGKWGNDNNWAPTGAPVITDNAILRANATIESGCVAEAKKITFEGTPTRTLTIADGGQLKTDNSVTATVKKNITGYGESDGGYHLISTPLDVSYGSASTYGMITDNLGSNATLATSTYDLYTWSTSSTDNYDEWRNYRNSTFYIANGTGYLYASKNGVELTFTGAVKANNTDISKTPSYTTDGTFEFNGWNLYANPFVCDAYINDVDEKDAETPMAFYRMNEQGDGYVAATGAIHPMEGIFVQATKSSQSFKFSREYKESNSRGQLNINLSKAGMRGVSLADNAIVRFGEGSTLEKFNFRENSSKVYIPMEGKDYAVVNAGQTGEMPVSFKAENNGSYTLSFSNENVEFSYLHLIDNMTGMDVNLLDNPSYSFEARTTDYAQRFRLVFATGSSIEDESFGFFNESGNFCIFGIEGNATVQVIDMMGRVLSSETVSGSYEKQISGTPGVYMVRLINGDNVRTQKVVVK